MRQLDRSQQGEPVALFKQQKRLVVGLRAPRLHR
jgi:hypothetical protein